jgi:C-terminal processing protease CtpA/Prc
VIRIRSFSQNTRDSVLEQLKDLEKQGTAQCKSLALPAMVGLTEPMPGTGADAFVIDLRGNPGGYLGGGIDTARLFLPAYEKIVTVIGRTGIAEEYTTTEDGNDSQDLISWSCPLRSPVDVGGQGWS